MPNFFPLISYRRRPGADRQVLQTHRAADPGVEGAWVWIWALGVRWVFRGDIVVFVVLRYIWERPGAYSGNKRNRVY